MSQQIPVVIGIGQFTSLSDEVSDMLSPADLAAITVKRCLGQVADEHLPSSIDCIAACRLFSDSAPAYTSPMGGSNNLPRSIASRSGLNPQHDMCAAPGGDSPQRLVDEQCERIYRGESIAGLMVGVETLRTTKRSVKLGVELDWNEDIEGTLDDKGIGNLTGLTHYEAAHGIGIPIQTHSLFEHALR